MVSSLRITPIEGLPLFKSGDDLARIIVSRARKLGLGIKNRDILVVGQKAVSKAEGRILDISGIRPSRKAGELAGKTGRRAEFIQTVLKDSKKVVRADKKAFIVRTKDGTTCLNGGIDKSNVEGERVYALLPEDPDASARMLRSRIRRLTGRSVGVIVCDTRSRPFRKGQVEETIGIAGLDPLFDYRGEKDLFGYRLRFKNVAVADELASAAELVMGQGKEATPAAIIRGLKRVRFQERASAKSLTVTVKEDLFRGTL